MPERKSPDPATDSPTEEEDDNVDTTEEDLISRKSTTTEASLQKQLACPTCKNIALDDDRRKATAECKATVYVQHVQ